MRVEEALWNEFHNYAKFFPLTNLRLIADSTRYFSRCNLKFWTDLFAITLDSCNHSLPRLPKYFSLKSVPLGKNHHTGVHFPGE